MSWEGPKNDKNNNSWSKNKGQDGPPDLDDMLKNFFAKVFGKGSGNSSNNDSGSGQVVSSKKIGGFIALVIAVWAVLGVYIVSPAEQAVILRFGKYVSVTGPGPHWLPLGIESEDRVNVQQVSNFAYTAEMLTKDENIVSVAVAVQYRIANPEDYLFNVVSPIASLKQATASALRQVVGQTSLDDVLTTGRQTLIEGVRKQLNTTLDIYNTGLVVTDVTLQPAKPPEQVTAAFDDAIKAREDEQRYINQAQAYARQVSAIAEGNIARLKQQAAAYRQEVVLKAKADTTRYLALLNPYKASPEVTRDRLYIDTISSVLSKTTNIFVETGGSNVLYLPLEQILRHQGGFTGKAYEPANNAGQSNLAKNSAQQSRLPASSGANTANNYSMLGDK